MTVLAVSVKLDSIDVGEDPLGPGVPERDPDANDGVVRVKETEVEGMTARALVAQGHSTMIFSSQVASLVERYLASAAFK